MSESPGHVVRGDNAVCVAYALLLGLAAHESKLQFNAGVPVIKADKEWLIENYKAIFTGINSPTPR